MKVIHKIINLVLPKRCLICRSPLIKNIGDKICLDCWKKAEFSKGPICPICGKAFLSDISLSSSPDFICGLCRKSRPHFDKHIYVGNYDGILLEAIKLFKYKKKVSLGFTLSYLLCKKIKDVPAVDIIIPMPLHVKRLRSREFNQTLLLSNLIALHLNKPLLKDVMIRIKDTIPQVKLDRTEREKNIRNVFLITNRCAIEGRRVLLIDDVFTTGSTVNECAGTLKRSGAYKVYVITLLMANT